MINFFQNVLIASFHGSIVILAVLLLRLVLRKAPRKYICWLWVLAGLRLLIPVPLQSSFSLQPRSIPIRLSIDPSILMFAAWAVVAVAIASYSTLSYIHLRRQVRDAVKIPGGWESDKIETAFVLGFIKPKIYIPTGMSKSARRQILAHERTHLDKGDHWIKMIGFLALALHWFNPLVWLSYYLLCKDIEMACDERVVQFMELDERKAYSSALLACSTNRVHYAASPVAFGEVSVKYRIQSVLHYRKPGFLVSLMCICAICFVAVCLVTSPVNAEQADAQAQLKQSSQADPASFTPAVLPEVEPNPDWGVTVSMDAQSTTGGMLIYAVEERFAAASERITMKNAFLERWNGSGWEPIPSQSGKQSLFEEHYIGFAQNREQSVNYFTEELDWTLLYGALPTGDYRICQAIESDTDSATFRTAFHIYREPLPSEEEAALERCNTALNTLYNGTGYSVTFSELDPEGNPAPVKRVTKLGAEARVDFYLGEFCTSSNNSEDAVYHTRDWDKPFRLNQNRRFLFPEGQSTISQEEISFRSVWTDYTGTSYRGTDTFRFYEDGTLQSADRLVQTLDGSGNVAAQRLNRLEAAKVPYGISIRDTQNFDVQDSFDAAKESPWRIFFRIDDDLLTPSGGEVWLSTETVGVSNYTADGTYWLEKKNGQSWSRLGGESKEASWGNDTVKIVSQTAVINVDWSADYGKLEPGVYRMGKRFFSGSESIIQYAQFAIYSAGGIYGEGSEEAIARVDAAIERLKEGSYRVEEYHPNYGGQGDMRLTQVMWKYGDMEVTEYYKQGVYSHCSYSTNTPEFDWSYQNWLKRGYDTAGYSSVYFPTGYSVISDREIRFAQAYSSNSWNNPCSLYTYRFDENGNITEIQIEFLDSMLYSPGRLPHKDVIRYVITGTPESEIQATVQQRKIECDQAVAKWNLENSGS